jgi:hypothetical protein
VQEFRCTTYPRKVGRTESPSGATLPEVAKFPLQNNANGVAATAKLKAKDTKPKGFVP